MPRLASNHRGHRDRTEMAQRARRPVAASMALRGIDCWRDAPVWTPESIAQEVAAWNEALE